MSAEPRSFYLGAGALATFVTYHPAEEADPSVGVVFCPPFGWDEISSHRGLRDWAAEVAAAGHPAVRIDPPGTGDGGGMPRDPGQVGAWTHAIADVARWLRAESGCARVTAIGIGLGGLIAYRAAATEEGVDDLVLWGVSGRGRQLVRELKAFARLNADQSATLAAETAPPDDGSLEAGGFVLSAETVADLQALDLAEMTLANPGGRRVLMLERDSIAPDQKLRAHLEQLGAEVEVAAGDGFGALTAGPQESRTPVATIAATLTWLAAAPAGVSAPHALAPPEHGHVELEVGGTAIRERPFVAGAPGARLHGVLTEPASGGNPAVRGLLLNAGAVRRTGPGRLWVELARQWAARGMTTLRIDLESIGDSDGTRDYTDNVALYVPEMVDNAIRALEEFADSAPAAKPPSYLLAGLCSGAFWGFHGALRDDRVGSVFMLNPRALYWRDNLEIARDARKMTRIGRRVYWKRMLTGRVSAERVRSVLFWALRAPVEIPRARRAQRRERRQVESAFDQLRDQGKRLLLVFGEDEPLDEELGGEGILDQLERWPNIELERLPGRDHTLRPIRTQQRLHEMLDRAVDRELAGADQADGSSRRAT